jgi:hypothetical protein
VPDRKDLPAQGSAAAPSGPAASEGGRSRALAALRDGRFDQAFDFYRNLPASEWMAEDCVTLGSALLERNRIGLGRAALEAARKIDTKDSATTAAINDFQRKQETSAGPERALLQEAVSRFEPLRSIRGGPPLGLLVLALAHYTKNNDQEEDFLDRVRAHNISLLPRLHAPGDGSKMAARLLLETGRPGEARDLLDSLLKTGRSNTSGSDRPAPDPEAAWLMSRAALQLDAHDTADAMLALAGDFGKTTAAAIEPSPFVGSKRCAECHRMLYRGQQHEGRHSQTLRFGADLKDVPLPKGPVTDEAIPSITHRFERKSDHEIELESKKEDQVFRAIINYAVGSGRHGITMLAAGDDRVEREVRVSYFGLDGTWGQTKGIHYFPQQPGDLVGMGMGQKAVNHCLSCHTTWFRSVRPDHEGARPPEGDDRGIGCERCHGPGLNHVKAAESGFAEMAIALTAKSPAQARLNSCVECHSSDGTVPPSDPEFTRFQGTTFLFSRCYVANKDRFNCTTCHDVHAALETDSTRYEAKCLECHVATVQGKAAASVAANSAASTSAGAARQCPVNPRTNCISCHMPTVEDPSRHARFTDHRIRTHGGKRVSQETSHGEPRSGVAARR